MRSLDIIVVLVYMIGIVWAGVRSRSKSRNADHFFSERGGFSGKLGTILVGLSMAATLFSGISFVVFTSAAYSNGAQIGLAAAGLPITWVVLRFWFLPRYLSASGIHPYDIIELRLGLTVRLCVSAMFVLLRLGWMAVMLVTPTIVLMGAAQLEPQWFWPIVIITGLSCTFYTAIGGIRSVIVTDALQFAVMIFCTLFIIGFILHKLDLPLTTVVEQLDHAGRLTILDFTFSFTQPFNVWGVLIGMTIGNLGSYMGDLMMLQRYLSADSPRSAARAFAINMWGVIGVSLSLVVIGLLLWVWYQDHPDSSVPANPDQVLAYFVTRELPAGVAGLLIASILAATMSSMTSGIIALAGTLTNDVFGRFGRARSPHELLTLGRYLSVGIGISAMLAAGLARNFGTLFQISQAVLGAFLGPMLGIMILTISGWKVRPGAVLGGIGLGSLTGWLVAFSPTAVVWVASSSALVTLAVPLLTIKRQPAPVTVS